MRKVALCYRPAMSTKPLSAIQRLVDFHDGPTKVAALIGDGFAYQHVQQWVTRGWASPLHFQRLEPYLPDGMTLRDLYADLEANKQQKQVA